MDPSPSPGGAAGGMGRAAGPIDFTGAALRGQVLEIVVAEQCNLTCRSCTHLSPIAPKWFADPAVLREVLARLRSVFQVSVAKLMGGEPLLHPRISAVIDAIRSSGIADEIHLITNGVLIGRASSGVLEMCDQITISRYPGVDFDAVTSARLDTLPRVVEMAMPMFEESFSRTASHDGDLTRRIYRACRVAHEWGCSTLYGTRFFKCPQAYVLDRLSGAYPSDFNRVGVPVLDSDDLRGELERYLKSRNPLPSCSWCLGTSGKTFAHVQLPRRQWLEQQSESVEALLDTRRLAAIEL